MQRRQPRAVFDEWFFVRLAGGDDGLELDLVEEEWILREREDGVHGGDERGFGTPVVIEREAVVHVLRGLEIGEYVRAAKAVDGLLRVADQEEQRGIGSRRGTEDAVEVLILHRVRVLELIDERGLVARTNLVRERVAAGRRQCGVQAGQEIVEGLNLEPLLALRQVELHEVEEAQLQPREEVRFVTADVLAEIEQLVFGRLCLLAGVFLECAAGKELNRFKGFRRWLITHETGVGVAQHLLDDLRLLMFADGPFGFGAKQLPDALLVRAPELCGLVEGGGQLVSDIVQRLPGE